MDFVSIVFGVVDLPLIIGIVVILEAAKRVINLPAKAWTLVLVLAGFGAATLKVNIGVEGWKALVVQGVIYAAAAEFAYQGWRTITKRRGK
jgi:hypothetical protein